ncbi:hypothetical protein [Mycobacterium sp. 1423905.2]|uniref:hypothetical protein n=1 Tax=Mycobacterium sp. 1423905.2 TaxID=1856859 RepID=UPI0007FFD669|nr:hypothetical protein [Mycobacterium sp. 1423905.2]OBJ49542.1 hypothetical protein A9W95_25595 [Mycobacterium sp. 1423905.2]
MAFSLPTNFATGGQFAAADANAIDAAINAIVNGATAAFVATSESTSSTTYTDLATTTDQVTVNIGSSGKALVFLSADISAAASGGVASMGFALSGANSQAASDSQRITGSFYTIGGGVAFLLTGLAAGSTTFKAKYKSVGATGTAANRRIAVIPFP